MKHPLTKTQERTYDWIFNYMDQHGVSPTIREITTGLNKSSPAPIWESLRQLREKGWLTWIDGTPRTIKLIGYKFQLVPVEASTNLDQVY